MTDPWAFWTAQLAGQEPESTPGTPHFGYFLAKEYITIPGGAKRVLTEIPVAIWNEDGDWRAVISRPLRDMALTGSDKCDELFARCCRDAIGFDNYNARRRQIDAWRSGNDNWKDAA